MVQDPIVGAPLLKAMSAHSVAEALQDCFVESLFTSATSLIVRRRSARMISRTHATVPLVREVDGLPGWGLSSKDRRPLLKWEYHSIVFDRLRQDSPKDACSISHVSAPDFPRRKQIDAHMLLHFSLHCEMRRKLQVAVP
jgi:hypothetical protein